jgi:hypothetical protein
MKSVPNLIYYPHKVSRIFPHFLAIFPTPFHFGIILNRKVAVTWDPPVNVSSPRPGPACQHPPSTWPPGVLLLAVCPRSKPELTPRSRPALPEALHTAPPRLGHRPKAVAAAPRCPTTERLPPPPPPRAARAVGRQENEPAPGSAAARTPPAASRSGPPPV